MDYLYKTGTEWTYKEYGFCLLIFFSILTFFGCHHDSNESEVRTSDYPNNVQVTIYYSIADPTHTLNQIQVNMEELTPENIWFELGAKREALADVEILSFILTEEPNRRINLDLSDYFQTIMRNHGAMGEAYFVASIVNTFLAAYDAEEIRITVEGLPLQSGHSFYDDYMGRFFD